MTEFTSMFMYLLDAGGVVMWVLIVFSIAIWSLLAFRFLRLGSHRFASPETIHECGERICAKQPVDDILASARVRGAQGLILKRLSEIEGKPSEQDLALAVNACCRAVASPHHVLATLIVASPLLGLLGTVCGMIQIFLAISIAGTSDPGMLATGISQAMLTTQAGLMVAVPGLYAEGRVKRLEEAVLHKIELTRLVLTRVLKEQGTGAWTVLI